MSEIQFFTPVYYGSLAKTPEEKAIQNVDSYFHISGKKAVVLQKSSDGREIVALKASRISAGTVFKTIGIALSWLTLVIPLVMLIAKAALRSPHKYVLESKINEKGDHSQHLHDNQVMSKVVEVQPAISKKAVNPVYKAPNSPAHPTKVAEKTVPPSKEAIAATALQKYIRGYNVRRPLLSEGLYPQYKKECAKAEGPESESIPQADSGKTRVYLPKDVPEVALKRSGREGAIRRFHQMQAVRKILEGQNSTHLVIPKASLCQEFLVEERLPINTNTYFNMGLYLSNPRMFDDAVREMTRLFSKIYLSDLVNPQLHPLSHIKGVGNIPRYDNLPLYVEEENGKKVGKIGLIDLEHMKEQPSVDGLPTLGRFFPLHEEIIREEAERLKIQYDSQGFAAAVKKGRRFLKVGYQDHLEWIKQKDKQVENPSDSIDLSPERVGALTDVVTQELLRLNGGENDLLARKGAVLGKACKDFIRGNPEEVARHLAEKIAPKIVANLRIIVEKSHQKNPNADLSEAEMISQRSQVVKREKTFDGVKDIICATDKIAFQDSSLYLNRDAKEIAEQLAFVVMKELERGGEIFCYDSAEYTGGHDLCWIRY